MVSILGLPFLFGSQLVFIGPNTRLDFMNFDIILNHRITQEFKLTDVTNLISYYLPVQFNSQFSLKLRKIGTNITPN